MIKRYSTCAETSHSVASGTIAGNTKEGGTIASDIVPGSDTAGGTMKGDKIVPGTIQGGAMVGSTVTGVALAQVTVGPRKFLSIEYNESAILPMILSEDLAQFSKQFHTIGNCCCPFQGTGDQAIVFNPKVNRFHVRTTYISAIRNKSSMAKFKDRGQLS